jgi:hypothetical protein
VRAPCRAPSAKPISKLKRGVDSLLDVDVSTGTPEPLLQSIDPTGPRYSSRKQAVAIRAITQHPFEPVSSTFDTG